MAGALMEERRFHLVLRSDESEYDDVANLWIWRLPSPIMLSNRLMQVLWFETRDVAHFRAAVESWIGEHCAASHATVSTEPQDVGGGHSGGQQRF